jgi:DNA-binding NarL/FixJ family response regulator
MAVRALIADGSPGMRNAIRHQLECMGCEVVAEVGTAGQAMLLTKTVGPEIVALGIGLSYDGQAGPIELLREIKREAPRASVVMLDSTNPAGDIEPFLREGALDCITEPFGGPSFSRLWSRLSTAFPQLRKTRFGAMMETPKMPLRRDSTSQALSEIEKLAQARTN